MKLSLICVGSLKERHWREAVQEYAKRLSAYCQLTIIEVKDEKTPEGASAAQEEQIRAKEGRRILEKIRDRSCVVILDIQGQRMSSELFSAEHERWETEGRGELCLVIGGSLGLSEELRARANHRVSFSDMTFPHQLMRVILLEQLYRSYRIRRNEHYHK